MREVYVLDVYRLAEELSDMVWNDFDHWSEKAQRTVGYQIIRSADSIAANLAEGYGRYSSKDKANFYRYSRGSFEETKCWLRKASRRSLITKEHTNTYKAIIDELGPKLNAFIRSTGQTLKPWIRQLNPKYENKGTPMKPNIKHQSSSCRSPSIKHQVSSILSALLLSSGAYALDTELHGFVDGRAGVRTQNDPYEDDRSLTELRLQLDSKTYFDWGELNMRGDFVYDNLATDINDVDLQTGHGFFDLRELNLLFTPVSWSDVKVGRQILTWGTGDLLFINDLFPKDWNSFLLGRDEEYLKAPSDAVYASFFPSIGSFDVAYMPLFDADRYIDGSRVSYWNPGQQSIAGQNAEIDAEQREDWFKEYELSGRFYRPLLSWEGALYGYQGFWKSPMGVGANGAYFPRMNAYGASAQGSIGAALANVELGYYDSRESSSATQIVPEDEFRFLVGYEREVAKNLTAGFQYYLEWMQDYDDYLSSVPVKDTARDELRHVLTLRLTKMMMNQNLMLSLFTFWSPSDMDAYFRPAVTYKVSDHWTVTANGNFFVGKDDYTFFGQFRYNSNLNLGVRYSF